MTDPSNFSTAVNLRQATEILSGNTQSSYSRQLLRDWDIVNPSSREATAVSEFKAAIFTTEKHLSTKNSSCSLGILYFGRQRSPVKTTAGARCPQLCYVNISSKTARASPELDIGKTNNNSMQPIKPDHEI